MAPVILRMEVHCLGCARKIRKVVKNLYGVENVWASPDTGLVVVAGSADAFALKQRIESKTRREVTIVSGGEDEPLPDVWQRQQALPPPQTNVYPYYSRMVYSGPPQHYYVSPPPPPEAYPYTQRRYVSTTRQYVPPAEPQVCFEDEKPPNGCCVQ
ncbi:hypothetical protein EJB05_03414, partial [Eragrostis curvula]